jgi:RNA polymerase sigma-70 factor (ECF subfamily)
MPDDRNEGSAKGPSFLRLFLPNERRLYAYALTLLPQATDAEDVLQEASLVMWDKFDERQPPDDFVAWGCRIVYFKVLDFRKKLQRSRVLFNQSMLERVAETAAEQGEALQLEERWQALQHCLELLRPVDRDLLARRFAEGATTESTAESIGRSVHAVYKALSRIRHALFECVARRLSVEGQT